jgi:hypothetical protein
MKEYTSNVVPLAIVGMLFNYAGNHMLNYI